MRLVTKICICSDNWGSWWLSWCSYGMAAIMNSDFEWKTLNESQTVTDNDAFHSLGLIKRNRWSTCIFRSVCLQQLLFRVITRSHVVQVFRWFITKIYHVPRVLVLLDSSAKSFKLEWRSWIQFTLLTWWTLSVAEGCQVLTNKLPNLKNACSLTVRNELWFDMQQ